MKAVERSRDNPMMEVGQVNISEYDIEFPIITIMEQSSDYDILAIFEFIENRPEELQFWDLENGFAPDGVSEGQYCRGWLEGFCSFCEHPINDFTACNGNKDNKLQCENGAISNETTHEDFQWTFCRMNNSSR